jgi:hypothetical protein
METWSLAAANLTSPPVLAFLLGLLATGLGGDLRLPEPVYQLLSVYLLLGIGIKGGVALSEAPAGEVLVPVLVTLALGIVIPLLAFAVLRWTTRLGPVDRGALAARRLRALPTAGPGLALFAVGFPVVAGTMGIRAGHAAGLSTGGSAVLGLLAASASSGESQGGRAWRPMSCCW